MAVEEDEEKSLEEQLESQLQEKRDSLSALNEALASDPSNLEIISGESIAREDPLTKERKTSYGGSVAEMDQVKKAPRMDWAEELEPGPEARKR